VRRAMRHTSPETKRYYQLGMADQVRMAVEKTDKRLYGKCAPLHFRDSSSRKGAEAEIAVRKELRIGEKLAPRARFELATLRLTAAGENH
jgi:hypothetical protein